MRPGPELSPLHSSTNGKTGIHVNGLRCLCRPLPPHSFLLLFLFLPCFSFSLFVSLSISLSPSRACFFLFLPRSASLSLSLHTQLSVSLSCTLSVSSCLYYFQIRISVIRTASLDETLFIDASPRVAPCSSFPPQCLGTVQRVQYIQACPCNSWCVKMYVCVCSQLNALSSEISTMPHASFHENFVPRDQR